MSLGLWFEGLGVGVGWMVGGEVGWLRLMFEVGVEVGWLKLDCWSWLDVSLFVVDCWLW